MDRQYAVKFLDEEKGIIEGLGIPYGGPVRKNVSELGKDLTGEYFSDKTDFSSVYYDGKSVKSMPALYHHGFDPDLKSQPIGEVIGVEDKPEGKWVKVQLDKANKYYEGIKLLIKRGALCFSSGAIPEGVKKSPEGFIEKWPWKELSTTWGAANPLAEIGSFKSLVESEEAMNKNNDKEDIMESTKSEEPKVDIKPDPAIPAETNGHAPGETKAPPAECAKKSVKCVHCGKAIQLPPEVLQALTALRDSANGILAEGGGNAEAQETAPDAETPAETTAENKPAAPPAAAPAPAPAAPAQSPPVAPPAEEKKPIEETKAIKSLLDGYTVKVETLVKEALKPLAERMDRLESMPAMPGPVRSNTKTIEGKTTVAENPHIETKPDSETQSAHYQAIMDDPDADSTVKTFAGRRLAELSISDVFANGPQSLIRK